MRFIGFVLAVGFVAVTASIATASSGTRDVRIEDQCDAATFPAEIGCVGGGNVSFAKFLEKLNPNDGGHGAWRFHFGRRTSTSTRR